MLNFKTIRNMARPIKETPILYGEDARVFEARMKNPPKVFTEGRSLNQLTVNA